MTLRTAYRDGARRARACFKLGSTMGADPGVAPRGDEVSHGTARLPYPVQAAGTSAAAADMTDELWDRASDRIAPGYADDTYGDEVIG